jgi:membrane-associated HD superfamily phosphohydrolase
MSPRAARANHAGIILINVFCTISLFRMSRSEGILRSSKQVFYKYYFLTLIFITFIGIAIFESGNNAKNQLVTTIGQTIMASGIVSILFKIFTFDIYIDTKIRGMLMEHNYLSNLSNDSLKRLILDAISALTKTKPEVREKTESENIFWSIL